MFHVSCFQNQITKKLPRTFLCYQHLNSLRRWKGMPKSLPSRETCPTIGNSENHRLKSCQIWWFRNPAITTCDVETPVFNRIMINQPINWYRISSINSISTSKFPGHQVFPLPNVKGSLPDLSRPPPYRSTSNRLFFVLAEPPQPSKAAGSLHCVHLLKCLRLGGKIINLVGDFNPFEKYARQNGFIFPKESGWKFQKCLSCHHLVNTVDGWNPVNQLIGWLVYPSIYKVLIHYPRVVGLGISEPSTVVPKLWIQSPGRFWCTPRD